MVSARSLYQQYAFNIHKGPLYESAASLPKSVPTLFPAKLIAYYLPQFHQIAENDAWWSPGFTEWTNVSKALPRYVGHLQPRLPQDLGFYDLKNVEMLRRQAEMINRGGIYGLCIHNYWFDGRKILETPLRLILENPNIDLRFCLNWANESWSRRWDGSETDILLEQRHSVASDLRYAESVLPALRDPRYIRIDGRPLLMVYRPSLMEDAAATVKNWRAFFIANGVGDPYLVMAHAFEGVDPRAYGFDAGAGFPPHAGGWDLANDRDHIELLDDNFTGNAVSYAALADRILANATTAFRLFPGVCPTWDNEARKPGRGFGIYGSTPKLYGNWLRKSAEVAMRNDSADERIVFINAWNEWAEGAYLEPDRHMGFAYLAETRRIFDELAGETPSSSRVLSKAGGSRFGSVVRRRAPAKALLRRLRQRFRLLRRADGNG